MKLKNLTNHAAESGSDKPSAHAVWRKTLGKPFAVTSLCASLLALPLLGHAAAIDQVDGKLSLMVLGSGGPAANSTGRASAGYLVFTDKKAKLLMDAGGGTLQRFSKSGSNIKDLEIILLSHTHIDHTGDLSSLIKAAYFQNVAAGSTRTAAFRVFGPAANGAPFPNTDVPQYPSMSEYVDGHYAMPHGVERYLNIFTKAIKAGTFAYTTTDLSPAWPAGTMETVLEENGVSVKSIAVKHGPVPSVAFRIDYMGKSIAYSGDTNSESDNIIKLAMDADVLVYDTAILDDPANPVMLQLHTTPTRIGQVAAAAKVKTLLLSHLTPTTEKNLAKVKDLIRANYKGKIRVARDLQVINLDD